MENPNPGSDISFLRFEDEDGIYKIVGIGPWQERVRVPISPEEYALELAQATLKPCPICGNALHDCACEKGEK